MTVPPMLRRRRGPRQSPLARPSLQLVPRGAAAAAFVEEMRVVRVTDVQEGRAEPGIALDVAPLRLEGGAFDGAGSPRGVLHADARAIGRAQRGLAVIRGIVRAGEVPCAGEGLQAAARLTRPGLDFEEFRLPLGAGPRRRGFLRSRTARREGEEETGEDEDMRGGGTRRHARAFRGEAENREGSPVRRILTRPPDGPAAYSRFRPVDGLSVHWVRDMEGIAGYLARLYPPVQGPGSGGEAPGHVLRT